MGELVHNHRRVAHWQSTSIHTEGVAAFESCPAYQNSSEPGLLFLSHCVPNPPDKGEKIRAHHELMHCASRWPVHLVCFARTERELEQAEALRPLCASLYVELLRTPVALAKGGLKFATGDSLTMSFYGSAKMKNHVGALAARTPLFATFAYSSAMGQYAPPGLPLVLDFVDIDSEKWFQFGETRHPGWLYRAEGLRLRKQEALQQCLAARTFVTTSREAQVLSSFAPEGNAERLENGVDAQFFDPQAVRPAECQTGERVVSFVGAMDYYPNVDAVCWFAENVFPEWMRRCPGATFWIVGRSPSKRVQQLARTPGIRVTGSVEDVRPFFAASEMVVAPMRIARGIQNKVLEALAMGKQVLASPEVASCFGGDRPVGLTVCEQPGDYVKFLPWSNSADHAAPKWDQNIREAAARRFSWHANLERLDEALRPFAATASSQAVAR